MADVDLNGWEVAYAMRYGDLNTMIATNLAAAKAAGKSKYPDQIDVSDTDARGDTVRVVGDVKPWMLSGGTQNIIEIAIVLDNCTVTTSRNTYAKGKITLGATLPLSVGLNGSILVNAANLMVTSPVYQFTMPIPTLEQLAINDPLSTWLTGLAGEFAIELTALNLNTKVDPGWEWLVPQAAAVAVSTLPGGASSDHLLVLLGMLTTSTPANAAPQVSNVELPVGATAAYFIGSAAMLQNLILKSLTTLFDGAAVTDFDTSDPMEIKELVPLRYDRFSIDGTGKDQVPATVTDLSLKTAGSKLLMSAKLNFPYQSVAVTSAFDCHIEFKFENGIIASQTTYTGSPETTVDAGPGLATSMWLAPLIGSLIAAAAAGVGVAVARMSAPVAAPVGANQIQLGAVGAAGQAGNAAVAPVAAAAAVAVLGRGARLVRWAEVGPVWQVTLGAGLFALITGGAIVGIPQIVFELQKGSANSVASEMDKFLANAIKPVSLPPLVTANLKISSVGLRGALVIGLS